MNDFTITELREIKRCLKYMVDGGVTPYSCLTIGLNKKVRMMIDTYKEYCPEIRDVNCINACSKCGEFYR